MKEDKRAILAAAAAAAAAAAHAPRAADFLHECWHVIEEENQEGAAA